MSKEQNRDDAEVVVSTILFHPDLDKNVKHECTRGMCEHVIDTVLTDPELIEQIIAYEIDCDKRVAQGQMGSSEGRVYDQKFRDYIQTVCGKDLMDALWMDIINYVEDQLIERNLIVVYPNGEGHS